MKILHLMRHGKSSWKYPMLSDQERPLKKRGKEGALLIAEKLAKKNWNADLWISSPAVRAYETAKIVASVFQKNQDDIHLDPKLYEAGLDRLIEMLKVTDDKFSKMIWFGHEPGFSLLVDYLSGKSLNKFPTSGFVSIELPITSWAEITPGKNKIVKFIYPKMFER